MPVESSGVPRAGLVLGYAAAIATVLIWAGWVVATRGAAQTLDVAVVALLRFAIPALLFMPLWLRIGLFPRGLSPWILLAIVSGAGLPFFVLVANGMRFAPAAEVGPLLPGTMPLFVALIAYAVQGERPSLLRRAGFALIALGIAAIVGVEIATGTARAGPGHLLVLTGAFMWAMYTVAFRRSGLSAFEAAALISLWSTLLVLPFGLMPLIEVLARGRVAEIAVQAVIQGVLTGVIGIVLFGVSILRLGASQAAAFAASIPAMAALLAIPVLGEIPAVPAIVGIVATTVGVALASGVFERKTAA